MKPKWSSTESLLTWKGCPRGTLRLGTWEPLSSWAEPKCIPWLARGEALAQDEREKKPGLARHKLLYHHISIFIECCHLSNIKLCCYRGMCSFPTNADTFIPYENSSSLFHYFLQSVQELVFIYLSCNKDGVFLQHKISQTTHPGSAAF